MVEITKQAVDEAASRIYDAIGPHTREDIYYIAHAARVTILALITICPNEYRYWLEQAEAELECEKGIM